MSVDSHQTKFSITSKHNQCFDFIISDQVQQHPNCHKNCDKLVDIKKMSNKVSKHIDLHQVDEITQ